jgi:hypothetical protein
MLNLRFLAPTDESLWRIQAERFRRRQVEDQLELRAAIALLMTRFGTGSVHRSGRESLRDQLLDDLVGDGEQPRRHFDSQRPRRLQVDDKLEFGRLHDREIGGLGALEDRSRINAGLTK